MATEKTTHWRDQLNSKLGVATMVASALTAFTVLVAGIVLEKTGAQQVKDADEELNDADSAQKSADVDVAQARSEKYSHEGEMAANLAVDKQIEHDRDEYQNAQAAGDKDKMAEIASHYNLQADGHTPDFSQGGFKDIETYRAAGYENGVRTARNVAVSSATKNQETAEERYKSAVERKESATRVKEAGDGLLGVAVPLSVITLLAGFAEFKLAKRTSMNETQQINNSDPNILKDNGLHKSFSSMSTGISI
ncbi:hypothetical protein VL10_23965 [Leclercia adecarboxylata]|nr:hypothetical protein VL10_23965 [Leclercia adecarboxylata]KMN66737.1 hypothetical protein VK95_04405 [Leclercia sp. LK8]